MSEWPRVTLAQLLSRSDETATLSAAAEYHEVTIRLWGKGVISRGKVRGRDVTTPRRFVRAGQLILSKIDARNGALGIVPPELDGAIVSNDFPSFNFHGFGRCSPAYIGWLVQSEQFVELCKASSEGTTNRVRIKEARFLDQKIAVPSLPEQRAIVARLDAISEMTRRLASHIDAIEADADALVLSLHNQTSGGRLVPLSDLIELHEKPQTIHAEQSYPQVGVRSFGGGLFAKAAVAGTDTTYRAFNRLYEDAIVLSQVKGWEGAIGITSPDLIGMYVSPEYRTFRCLPGKAAPRYLSEIFKRPWFWSLLQNATRGVGARRERTRPEQFLNVKLPMPEYRKQLAGAETFEQIAALKRNYAAIQESAAALLPATLRQLFSA